MQDIANQIHKSLLKKIKTVSVAESCTGGLLCASLTGLSGSSGYFVLGIIAYSNQAKHKLLGIPLTLINAEGAVSYEVALKMAESVRKLAKTDYGISITGIAGPKGGTAQKPVGTVYIAASNKKKTICQKFLFKGSRASIRKQSVAKALDLFREFLE
jgi:nicotinamide-nucleotide amidase